MSIEQRVSTGNPREATIPFGPGVVVSGRVLYTSGITARDGDGNVVGPGDMAAQIEQVFQNLGDIFTAAGTNFSRVIKYTIFVTDIGAWQAARHLAFPYYVDKPAATLVEVSRLADPDVVVEVEAVAAVDYTNEQ